MIISIEDKKLQGLSFDSVILITADAFNVQYTAGWHSVFADLSNVGIS